jgi:C-terminal processing protease CtpA/Prc
MAVDRSEAEDLIAGLVQLVREHYVLPDRVDTIAAQLRQGLSSGEYEGSEDAQEMTLKITADLRESSGDLHFGIRPKPPTAAPKSRPGAARRSSDESSVPAPSRTVSGLGRVDTLAGDIGYIEVVAFPDPALGEAAVDEAFDRLAGTRAMILDLRRSRGGHPGMVAYLLSYFFDGEPFLFNRLEWPSSGKTLEFETVADLPSPRFTGRPVFILTSRGTPSAAEGFSYHMQHLGRALVVGERTAGAAHLNQMFELPGYQVAIPTGRPVSPITGGNWEGSGVVPDYEVAADQALDAGLELAADRARGR